MKARKAHKIRRVKRGESPEGRLLVIDNASELLTLKGDNRRPRKGEGLKDIGSIQNGAVVIENGRIIRVGPRDEVLADTNSEGAVVLDASDKVVMPGFVDPHTHLVFAGSREKELGWKIEGASYTDIAERGGGIVSTMRATREASHEQLLQLGKQRLDVMLRHGTTSVEAKSGYGLRTKDEIKILEVTKRLSEEHQIDISPTFLGAHAVPPEFKDNTDAYVNQVMEEMLPVVADEELADFCDVFCERGFFDADQSRRILNEGKTYGLIPKVHADELSDLGGAELAADVGAISADHLEKASDAGLGRMIDEDVVGVLLPGTSFSTNLDYPEARHMIDMGLPVALATDFNPNCWTKSMHFIISLACYKMRMFPSEAIVASTINAAHAVGRAGEVGSLEPGKLGDVIVLNIGNHEQIPYQFAFNHVETVIKAGEVVYRRE
ncbi:MAG: imidazolonepropionase [Methanomassiliicoccales archaeon]|nr:MAG: imidazolonepropionase [Methanomassiliicoccales archaeon]